MKWISIALVLAITGCGKHKPEDSSLMEKGIIFLNQGQYDEAIEVFDRLRSKDPQNKTYVSYLAQSYAGCGGFSALNFYNKIKIIQAKNPKYLQEYLTVLDVLGSSFNEKQYYCLEKAQDLYFTINDKIRNISIKNSNFQWSLFLAHKIIQDLKEIKRLSNLGTLSSKISLYNKLDSFLQAAFQFYLMVDYSYLPLQKISGEIEELLKNFIWTYYGPLIVSSNSENYKEFILHTIDDNPDFLEFVIETIHSAVLLQEEPVLLMLKNELNWAL